MNTDQQLLSSASAEPEGQSLFEELAGLVPPERRAEYYRVIAHTRTLSPDDEMLRVLEAMGILALITRETPAEIAGERKALRKLLNGAALHADEVEKRIIGYTSKLESRISQLPHELEAGLDPPRIAKLLGESLRQYFQQSSVPETIKSLSQSCSQLNVVQKQLIDLLQELGHPDGGVIAKVQSANDSLLSSVSRRAKQIDELLGTLEKQVWAIWLPIVASAALAFGFFLGNWFGERRTGPETPSASQLLQGVEPPNVPLPAPQRRAKAR